MKQLKHKIKMPKSSLKIPGMLPPVRAEDTAAYIAIFDRLNQLKSVKYRESDRVG